MQLRLYGVAFILAGIIMFIITLVQLLKYLSFRNCELVTATVMSVDKHGHYANGRHQTSYSMKVAYTVDGMDYERKMACGSEDYALGTDRQVELRYKAHNPKRIMLNVGEEQTRAQKILWIITAALFAIGIAMLLLA